jgi:hypothetical protein
VENGGIILSRENSTTWKKLLPQYATLSTSNHIWASLGLKLGLLGMKTATNHLSRGIALMLLNMDYE